MEEEDYPNFGNAFPAATPTKANADGQASWNPALRPDVILPTASTGPKQPLDADDDFFDRYPGATPEKTRKNRPVPEDDFLETPGEEEELVKEDSATADGEHNVTGTTQMALLETTRESEQHIQASQAEEQPAAQPAAHYEHQSEISALDKALDESERAPLMEDEQPLPKVALLNDSPLQHSVIPEQTIPSAPERSFTTNFTTSEDIAHAQQPAIPQSNDWPAVGDDKMFADLLQDTTHTGHAESGGAPVQAGDHDLDAAWAAALEDDDILIDNSETDPNAFFGGDDDDGFLADDFDTAAPEPAREQQRSVSAYAPVSQTYSLAEQPHSRSAATPDTGLYGVHTFGQPTQIPVRPGLAQTQSFVDKPRSDYQSPYDLPIDVVKPRKRPQMSVQPSQASQGFQPQPPPRTSSYGAADSAVKDLTSFPNHMDGGLPQPSNQALGTPSVAPAASRAAAGFFADLPVTARTRSRPSGAYTPHQSPASSQGAFQQQIHPQPPPLRNNSMMAPPQLPPSQSHPGMSAVAPPSSLSSALRQPEKAPLFPDQGTSAALQSSPPRLPSNAVSINQGRYSPVLPAATQPTAQSTRYSPAPADPTGRKSADRYSSSPSSGSAFPPSRQPQAYLPRTSSPLATHGRPVPMQSATGDNTRRASQYISSSPGKTPSGLSSPNEYIGTVERNVSPDYKKPSLDISTSIAEVPQDNMFRPPQPYQPTTASRTYQGQAMSNTVAQAAGPTRLPHRRQFSKDLPFSAPNDDRAADQLQRWKGHAIFHWSNGGLITSSIPRQTPYYAAGSQGPSIKCTSGDVKVVEASQVFALHDIDTKFPGPLPARSKSKKKELSAWLGDKIGLIAQTTQAQLTNYELTDAERVAADEKLVLWRLVQVYLENDGVLDGTVKLTEQVRQILLPDLAAKAQVVELQSPTSGRGILPADVVDTAVIGQIRQALFEGNREHAVRLAEEKRLWGHAMLIASTMDPDNFRQIISSFVRSQVKSQGGSEFRSLASLYQVFAGSAEDCVDELVPPSARAGFQMINTASTGDTGEALGGLDKWRETVSLVHSNPTPHNAASILAIGRLLKSYGRLDAAHTCFIFARALAKHNGSDDPEADFVLLGVDAAQGHVDLDALMLTEIYEFASSFGSPANQWQYVPHLQAYKLLHGQILAAHGLRSQAQHFCDHVDTAIKATTRPSGYYHQGFAQELIKFNEYLSQSPHSGAGGGGKFFSRPAIGKVSSGMGSWFTKFVSGDEGDSDSNASGHANNAGEVFGPFGGVSANSMPISRNTSTSDLQGESPMLAQSSAQASSYTVQPPVGLPSRYTPHSSGTGSKYAPLTSSASVTSLNSDRSFSFHGANGMPSAEPIRSASARYAPASAGNSPALLGVQGAPISRRASNQSLVSTGSYEPRPALAEQDGFGYTHDGDSISSPSMPVEEAVEASSLDQPATANGVTEINGYSAEDGTGYIPPTMTYMPPTTDEPEHDEENISASTSTIKKKSFMDDDNDDDLASRVAALNLNKSQASRDPDPAVLAAAQADAARAGQSHDKRASGWFGGWFGKKEGDAAPGPVKAKLGEESSFYFDKDLNKWVNKKAGADAATPAAATPPPPRGPPSVAGTPSGSGPPSRNVSRAMPSMNGPASRQGTPAATPLPADVQQLRSTSSSSNITEAGPGSMGPPPRPSSSMSTASSLDDLLGGPGTGRKGPAGKAKKKGGRYVDVMASAK